MTEVNQLFGVEIVWWDDWYDGPVAGLARSGDRRIWFVVDRATRWWNEKSRRYLAYELFDEELEIVHAASALPEADRPADFVASTLGAAWTDAGDVGYAPSDRDPIGWFLAK